MENIYNISYVKLYEPLFQKMHEQAILSSLIITSAYCWVDRIRDLYPGTRPLVIHPPVDVGKFSFLAEVPRNEKIVLTIARIDPSKQLHKVILLSKLVSSDIKFIIAGSLTEQYVPYYSELNKLIKQLNVEDRVRILTNVSGKQLLDLMKKSSIFFYATSDGFPIAKAEATAAGLIPVVPDLCGVNEGVPREYVYKNLEEAARIIEENINAPVYKRVELSNNTERFSKQTFKAKLKLVISKVLDLRGYDS
jgi:glycosyltransferase involved in cell wall biosynthesis